jgi:hypothetical protein
VDAGVGTATILRSAGTLSLRTAKTSWTTLASDGTLTHTGAYAETTVQNATLAVGSNTVSLNASTATLRITTVTGGANNLSTLNGGFAGRTLRVCHIASGGDVLNDTFAGGGGPIVPVTYCRRYWYDGTSSAWRREDAT